MKLGATVTDTFTIFFPNGRRYTWPCNAKMLKAVEARRYDFMMKTDGTLSKDAMTKLMREADKNETTRHHSR